MTRLGWRTNEGGVGGLGRGCVFLLYWWWEVFVWRVNKGEARVMRADFGLTVFGQDEILVRVRLPR